MKYRWSILMVTMLVLALIFTACQPQPPAAPAGAETTESSITVSDSSTIKIGAIGPLSSPGTVVGGIAMQWAMNQAVKDINAQGGVLGKQLELVFADTEGLPERGMAVAERLINENQVVALAGEYHSAVGLAVAEVAHKYGIPVLFSETWADSITELGYPEVFRIAPASTIVSKSVADWLSDVGVETVLIIAENTDYGQSQVNADTQFMTEAGLTVLDPIFTELGTQDYQPILTRIQAMNPPPDVISIGVTGESSYNLERQITDLGLAPTSQTIGIANQVAIQPEFWESVPNGTHWVFSLVGLPPSLYNDITRHVAGEYNKAFNTEPASYVLEAYDTIFILADAITRAGTTEPQALISAIEDTDLVLAQGRYWFEYTSKNPLPEDGSVPPFMWHQWPDPAVLMIQYTEPNQDWKDAPVVWPPTYQTHGTNYFRP